MVNILKFLTIVLLALAMGGEAMKVGRIRRIVFMLVSDPKQFFLRFKAKVKSLFTFQETPFEQALKGGCIFKFDFNYDPAVKNMYLGIYEIETVEVITRILKEGDTFIDVGANIGYLSTVALGLVGKTGQVHSFEPVHEYFTKLKEISLLNPKYNASVNQCALGELEGRGKIAVTSIQNIGWNTLVPGLMTKDTTKEIQEVPIRRLDRYILEKALTNIALIKIDTEGFEFPVLIGLKEYFESRNNRPAVICEIAPSAYQLLGYQLTQLSVYMKKYSYDAFRMNNPKKRIDITKLEETTNVLFLPQN